MVVKGITNRMTGLFFLVSFFISYDQIHSTQVVVTTQTQAVEAVDKKREVDLPYHHPGWVCLLFCPPPPRQSTPFMSFINRRIQTRQVSS